MRTCVYGGCHAALDGQHLNRRYCREHDRAGLVRARALRVAARRCPDCHEVVRLTRAAPNAVRCWKCGCLHRKLYVRDYMRDYAQERARERQAVAAS